MARTPRIVLGALNISADPHPTGIYRRLFQAAADKAIHLRGHDWAKITAPQDRETDPPSFFGRILVWTEIDKDGRWLKQDANREAIVAVRPPRMALLRVMFRSGLYRRLQHCRSLMRAR